MLMVGCSLLDLASLLHTLETIGKYLRLFSIGCAHKSYVLANSAVFKRIQVHDLALQVA